MRVQRKAEELAFEQTNLEREVVPDPVSASRDRNRAQTPRPWSLPLLTRSTVPYPLSPHIEHERVLPPGSLAETVSHVLASVAPGSHDPERRDCGTSPRCCREDATGPGRRRNRQVRTVPLRPIVTASPNNLSVPTPLSRVSGPPARRRVVAVSRGIDSRRAHRHLVRARSDRVGPRRARIA